MNFMLLAIDIGNSSVSFGVADVSDKDNLKIIASSKISAQKGRSADEYAVLIREILRMHLGEKNVLIDRAAISSVVPTLTSTVAAAAHTLTGSRPFLIGPGIHTGFRIAIDDPSTLGADIVANTAAALRMMPAPLVIFDAGTANTLTVVNSDASLDGLIIMPGIRISASSLHDNAELIDSVEVSANNIPLVGKNTEQSILSGLINGNAAMVDGIVRTIRESLIPKNSEQKLGLIATGGYVAPVIARCRNKFVYDEHLTLSGIAALFSANCC